MQRWFLEFSWGALSCFWSRGDELSSSQRALLAVISPRLTLGASGEAQGRRRPAGLPGLGVSEGAAGPLPGPEALASGVPAGSRVWMEADLSASPQPPRPLPSESRPGLDPLLAFRTRFCPQTDGSLLWDLGQVR